MASVLGLELAGVVYHLGEVERFLPFEHSVMAGREMMAPVKPTAVVFVGGCTESEIQTVRALSREMHRDFIVFTTGVINGRMMVQQLSKVLQKSVATMLAQGLVQFCSKK